MQRPLSIRALPVSVACLVSAACIVAGCEAAEQGRSGDTPEAGRLTAQPSASGRGDPATGMRSIGHGDHAGYLFVPRSYEERRPAPLVMTLHGAGGNALGAARRVVPFARRSGAIVISPKSEGTTWDYVLGGYGPDAAFIDATLRRIFGRFAIDPDRVGIQGFSDGATYALSLGLTNGDLFRHVVAFSPGSMDTDDPHGSPVFFITHGVDDPVLPIEETSHEIVTMLREQGYAVTFREFPGRHEIPDPLVPKAFRWLDGASPSPRAHVSARG